MVRLKTLDMKTVECGKFDVPTHLNGRELDVYHFHGEHGESVASFQITHHPDGRAPTVRKVPRVNSR